MISINAEPNRMSDMILKGLMNSAFDVTKAYVTEAGIKTTVSKGGTMGALCHFNSHYFKKFETDEEIQVLLTKDLHKGLAENKFSGEDSIDLTIDVPNGKFLLKSPNVRWSPKISNETMQEVAFPMELVPGIGYLPKDPRPDRQPECQIKIADDSVIAPQVDKVIFEIAGGKVQLKYEYGGGPAERDIVPKDNRKVDIDKSYTLSRQYLTPILANFSGDLWLTFYQKGVFFTQVNSDFSLTYYLGTTV